MARNGTQQRGVFDSERRFRLLVEGIVDYAICMLDPNGIVTNWNAGAKRIKGYEAAEVIGRHFGMFYLPEDREAGMPARSLAAARENGKFEAEGWRLRDLGSTNGTQASLSASPRSRAILPNATRPPMR